MRKRRGAVSLAVAALLLCGLAACDADGDPAASPTARTSSTESGNSTSAPASPATDRAAQVKAAQQQYVKFYGAYIDAQRAEPTGAPPESLLAMTDPDGNVHDWLTKTFVQNESADARVVGGRADVTTGPELDSGQNPRIIRFRACHDQRSLKIDVGGKRNKQPWLFGKVEMRSSRTKGYDASPDTWKVFAMDLINADEPCKQE